MSESTQQNRERDKYQDFYDFMSNEHNLILTESEIHEIMREVNLISSPDESTDAKEVIREAVEALNVAKEHLPYFTGEREEIESSIQKLKQLLK